jgi:hypothetical protein
MRRFYLDLARAKCVFVLSIEGFHFSLIFFRRERNETKRTAILREFRLTRRNREYAKFRFKSFHEPNKEFRICNESLQSGSKAYKSPFWIILRNIKGREICYESLQNKKLTKFCFDGKQKFR